MKSDDKKSYPRQSSKPLAEQLIDLAIILSRQSDINETLRIISEKLNSIFRAGLTSIILLNPQTQHTIRTVINDNEEPDSLLQHTLQMSIFGWVFKNNQSFLSEDIAKDYRFTENSFNELGYQAAVCAPLISENNIIGSILLLNKKGEIFATSDIIKSLNMFCAVAGPSLNNVQKIANLFKSHVPDSALISKYKPFGLLGKSSAFIQLLKSIDAAAQCDVRVLLEGQSGTGKELIAKAIHCLSERANQAFIAIDCGAVPSNLIESELFGYVKGSFTGATHDRKGLLEACNQGTLFLDEITNLPAELQSKLLRVLQENEFRRLGSNQPIKVDIRIITASSAPLFDMVKKNKFREDLYYRLYVYPITIPTLNERPEDISLLANYFLENFSKKHKKKLEFFAPSVIRFINTRSWPGNIRQLENFIERLVTLADPKAAIVDEALIPAEHLDEYNLQKSDFEAVESSGSLTERLLVYEKKLITAALDQNNWNQSKAARTLQISEGTIRQKMKKLNLKKPEQIIIR